MGDFPGGCKYGFQFLSQNGGGHALQFFPKHNRIGSTRFYEFNLLGSEGS